MADAGVSADPHVVAHRAQEAGVDFIAIGTYTGIASSYIRALQEELERAGMEVPIFVGGKLNQIPEDSLSSLPEDVTDQLTSTVVTVCHRVEDMLTGLVRLAQPRQTDGGGAR